MSDEPTPSQSLRSRSTDEVHIIWVLNVPQYCRWQELKDLVRDAAGAKHARQADVELHEDGTHAGLCTVGDRAEADRAYGRWKSGSFAGTLLNDLDYLVANGWNGHSIQVGLLRKRTPHDPAPERVRGPEWSRSQRRAHARLGSGTTSSQAPTLGMLRPMPTSPTYPSPPPRGPPSYPRTISDGITPVLCGSAAFHVVPNPWSSHRPQNPYTVSVPPQIAYTSKPPRSASDTLRASSNDTRTNRVSARSGPGRSFKGGEQSKTQGVVLENIPATYQERRLKILLSSYGKFEAFRLVRRNGNKGLSATLRYNSVREAENAVRHLHKAVLDGRQVRAFLEPTDPRVNRFDHATPTRDSPLARGNKTKAQPAVRPESQQQSGPLVVNGARGDVGRRNGRSRRLSSIDSDDSSDGDTVRTAGSSGRGVKSSDSASEVSHIAERLRHSKLMEN